MTWTPRDPAATIRRIADEAYQAIVDGPSGRGTYDPGNDQTETDKRKEG